MHVLSNDAAFVREARDLVFQYSLEMSRGKSWEDLLNALAWVYTREHDFTFYINGSGEGKTLNIEQWVEEATPEMKANYQHGMYVMSNLLVFPEERKVEYVAHQLVDGKVASQNLVVATLVREDGRLKYKHADIYYEFI